MNIGEAFVVVNKLARGIDPITNEEYPEKSPYNQPEVIRALFTVLNHLPKVKKSTEQRQEENLSRGMPRNAGLPWSEEARVALANSYQGGTSIEALTESFERTKLALVAELHRQGLISDQEADDYGYRVREYKKL